MTISPQDAWALGAPLEVCDAIREYRAALEAKARAFAIGFFMGASIATLVFSMLR